MILIKVQQNYSRVIDEIYNSLAMLLRSTTRSDCLHISSLFYTFILWFMVREQIYTRMRALFQQCVLTRTVFVLCANNEIQDGFGLSQGSTVMGVNH